MPLTLQLLQTFSSTQLCLLLIGGSMVLSVAGLVVIRRLVPLAQLSANREVAGTFLQVIGTTYAVLIAFMVFLAWSDFDEADRRVEHEANEVATLFEDARGLPEPTRSVLLQHLHEYAQVVVDEEWSHMARGQVSQRAWEVLYQLWQPLRDFEPRTARDNAFYLEALRRLNLLGDYRRLRLLSSQDEMPRIFWILLVLGGVLTVGFTYGFDMEKFWAHAMMTATLAGMLAFILVLILMLEHPFSGDLSVSPQAFRQVLQRFETVHPLAPSPQTQTQTQ